MIKVGTIKNLSNNKRTSSSVYAYFMMDNMIRVDFKFSAYPHQSLLGGRGVGEPVTVKNYFKLPWGLSRSYK